jgi:hypothetical protein
MHKRLFCLAASVLLLAGCEESVTGAGTPRLSLLLTDAPGDFREANVRIEKIYLQGDDGEQVLYEGDGEYVDLLTLGSGRTAELVRDAVVEPGTYSQLRFVVCDAYVRTKDDRVYATPGATLPAGVTADGTLQAPSACQSGFKVKLPGGSVTLGEGAKVMVVDFDVSQSFGHQAGNSGKWVMHPVLQATDFSFSGNIAGTVALDSSLTDLPASCGGDTFGSGEGQVPLVTKFVPRVRDGEDVKSGAVAADGSYAITFVSPGAYEPTYEDELVYSNGDTLTFQATAVPASVTVESGATATVDYTVDGASCRAATASSAG